MRLQRLFLKGGHFFVDAVRNIQTLWDGNVGADDHLTAITIVNGTHNHLRLGQVLKPVCCEKRQKLVPDHLLVWEIRAL